jgi:hypothetical protein
MRTYSVRANSFIRDQARICTRFSQFVNQAAVTLSPEVFLPQSDPQSMTAVMPSRLGERHRKRFIPQILGSRG